MTVKYYAIVSLEGAGSTVESPAGVFRVTDDDTGRKFEGFNRDNKWEDMPFLCKYFSNGEIGAEEITEKQANAIINKWMGDAPNDS